MLFVRYQSPHPFHSLYPLDVVAAPNPGRFALDVTALFTRYVSSSPSPGSAPTLVLSTTATVAQADILADLPLRIALPLLDQLPESERCQYPQWHRPAPIKIA